MCPVDIFVQSNTSVTHLDLSDCGLATEGGVAITSMFRENCYITHLVTDPRRPGYIEWRVSILSTGSL